MKFLALIDGKERDIDVKKHDNDAVAFECLDRTLTSDA